MPGMSGTKVLEYIRSQRRLNKVRVIVATADPDLASAMHIQPELVLLKPISFSQLSQLAACFAPNKSFVPADTEKKV
jgi:CheY-like chemotaxis protein